MTQIPFEDRHIDITSAGTDQLFWLLGQLKPQAATSPDPAFAEAVADIEWELDSRVTGTSALIAHQLAYYGVDILPGYEWRL